MFQGTTTELMCILRTFALQPCKPRTQMTNKSNRNAGPVGLFRRVFNAGDNRPKSRIETPNRRGMRLILPLAFLFASISGLSQTPPAQSSGVSLVDNSKQAVVVQKSRTTVRFENDGNETRDISAQIRVQSDAGVKNWGILNFGYNSD